MGRSQRASFGSRGLAVGLGVVCVLAASLPAALSTVTADDQSSLGAGLYPAAYAITGAKIVAAPGKTYRPGHDRGAPGGDRGGRARPRT